MHLAAIAAGLKSQTIGMGPTYSRDLKQQVPNVSRAGEALSI
jgi:hypothetical protein